MLHITEIASGKQRTIPVHELIVPFNEVTGQVEDRALQEVQLAHIEALTASKLLRALALARRVAQPALVNTRQTRDNVLACLNVFFADTSTESPPYLIEQASVTPVFEPHEEGGMRVAFRVDLRYARIKTEYAALLVLEPHWRNDTVTPVGSKE